MNRKMPKRLFLKGAVDLLLFFLFCLLAGTGLLLQYRLVPGYQGGKGLTLLGWSRHDWGTFHFWTAISLIPVLATHLYFNAPFIRQVIGRRSKRLLIVYGLIAAMLFLFFLGTPLGRAGR